MAGKSLSHSVSHLQGVTRKRRTFFRALHHLEQATIARHESGAISEKEAVKDAAAALQPHAHCVSLLFCLVIVLEIWYLTSLKLAFSF
jgi:hypothetical protein